MTISCFGLVLAGAVVLALVPSKECISKCALVGGTCTQTCTGSDWSGVGIALLILAAVIFLLRPRQRVVYDASTALH
jgi:hypothetical protein